MIEGKGKLPIRDRVTAVLRGQTPDRLPFIDRMELWYASKSINDALPDRFKGMSLNDVHRAVGMGRQKFSTPYAFKLHGVADFKAYVHRLLQTIGDQPIILGVGDMVLGNNLIERVEYIAEQVEKHPLN